MVKTRLVHLETRYICYWNQTDRIHTSIVVIYLSHIKRNMKELVACMFPMMNMIEQITLQIKITGLKLIQTER